MTTHTMKQLLTKDYQTISNYVNAHRDAKIAANSATGINFEYLATHAHLIGLWAVVFLTHLPSILEIQNACPKELITMAREYRYV